MIPAYSLKIIGKFRRTFVMVLLFTFGGMSIIAQTPDSIQYAVDTTELERLAPGQEPARRPNLQPRSEPLEDNQYIQVSPDSSQKGLVLTQADSTIVEEKEEGHSPRKAMIYSIVLPGAGQAYNKKYWKMPIVYAALGGAGYAIYYNTQEYRAVLTELELAPNDADLLRYTKYWRRNMELSYIAIVLVDALAVVDAYVDAHLFYWDVDPDLTIRVEPSIQPLLIPDGSIMNTYSIRASFTF